MSSERLKENSLKRQRSPQKLVVVATISLAIIVLGTIGGVLVREYLFVDLASSLILRDRLADSAYWKLTETRHGTLIQPTSGRYRGWYLDVDESLAPVLIDDGLETSEAARFLVLSRRARQSAYWSLIDAGNGRHLLQSTRDATQKEYLDIAGLDVPDRGDGFIFARNLLINPHVQFLWNVKETERGTTIQATSMGYDGWYLAADDRVAPNETVTVKSDPTLQVEMQRRKVLQQLKALNGTQTLRARISSYERA